jgi:hypothetical protein
MFNRKAGACFTVATELFIGGKLKRNCTLLLLNLPSALVGVRDD